MESVGAGLGHDIDHAARMQAELRLHGVGLHAEFLHRVRERNRQVHVAEGIVVVAAVQQVVDAVGLAAGHARKCPIRSSPEYSCCLSDRRRAVVPPPTSVSNWVRLRPLSGRSTILRCSITCAMALSLVSTIDAFAATSIVSVTEPTLKRDIDFTGVADLQNDSCLTIVLKARRLYLERIGPRRQIAHLR